MSKHHHQSKEEQINNRLHNTAQVRHDKASAQKNDTSKPEKILIKAAVEQSLIQERAYQIHNEKGGSPLENWLEAEQMLGHKESDRLSSIDHGSSALIPK